MNLPYKYLFLSFIPLFLATCSEAQGVITTIAGNGITQYIGEGSPADSFSLADPVNIYVDHKGKVYVADNADSRIMTVYHDTLTTLIGKNGPGETGDGGLADTATLRNPYGVCLDTAGNIYITEWYNSIIRRVDAHTGIINTVCGITGGGYGGDGGKADTARLAGPHGACTDKAGNIYIPDYNNHRIRKITVATGIISTIAGTGVNGYSGDSSLAVYAMLSYPSSVCLDTSGNIYFSETGNNIIRRIDTAGIITTIAGNGSQGYAGDSALAVNAQLSAPNSVFADKRGNIYISDYNNNVIRAITPSGHIFTIAGTGAFGYTGDNGNPRNATFRGPTGVCADDSGYIYIADGFNSVIRKMSPIDSEITEVRNIAIPRFDIYPNPTSGKFIVAIPQQLSSATISVFNMLGQYIYQTPVTSANIHIDLSRYPAGMYYIQYTSPDGNAVKKLLIR